MTIRETKEQLDYQEFENVKQIIPLLVNHFSPDGGTIKNVKLHLVDGEKGTKFIAHVIFDAPDGMSHVIRTLGNLQFSFLKLRKLNGLDQPSPGEDIFKYDTHEVLPTEFAAEAWIEKYIHARHQNDPSVRFSRYYSEDLTNQLGTGVSMNTAAHIATNLAKGPEATIPLIQPKSNWAGDW